MLRVIMTSVAFFYAECRYAEYHHAECCFDDCRYAEASLLNIQVRLKQHNKV